MHIHKWEKSCTNRLNLFKIKDVIKRGRKQVLCFLKICLKSNRNQCATWYYEPSWRQVLHGVCSGLSCSTRDQDVSPITQRPPPLQGEICLILSKMSSLRMERSCIKAVLCWGTSVFLTTMDYSVTLLSTQGGARGEPIKMMKSLQE